jgi:hypothetical protein
VEADAMRRENAQICDASKGDTGLAFPHAQSVGGGTVQPGWALVWDGYWA